jgi:hypothetical protein
VRVRSLGFEAAGERVRLGLVDEAGARSYRELRGPEKERALAWIATRATWLRAREPGIEVRSMRVQIDEARVLLTLVGVPPRAITLDGASYDDFASGIDTVI